MTGPRAFILIAIVLISTVSANAQIFQSQEEQIGLLELYTSEGCSSCPPADRWLSTLTQDERLWSEVIPIAFHVDYWDYIGWKDRFASKDYSDRQRLLAAFQGQRTIYTPGFFYNGQEWRDWLRRALGRFPAGGKPGVLTVEAESNNVIVRFAPNQSLKKPRVQLALLGFGLTTEVKAGENHGRTLSHDFVVLGVATADLNQTEQVWQGQLDLPTSRHKAARLGLVAWIQDSENPEPIQTVGGWLDSATRIAQKN